MSAFTDLEIEYMAGQRLGRIATVGAEVLPAGGGAGGGRPAGQGLRATPP